LNRLVYQIEAHLGLAEARVGSGRMAQIKRATVQAIGALDRCNTGFIAPCLPIKTVACRPAANGCTRSSPTASASLPAKSSVGQTLKTR
jgi:hypothetical protein